MCIRDSKKGALGSRGNGSGEGRRELTDLYSACSGSTRSTPGAHVETNGRGWAHESLHRVLPVLSFRVRTRSWRLRPGEAGWSAAQFPELGDLEFVPSGACDLEDPAASGADDLGREVDGPSA